MRKDVFPLAAFLRCYHPRAGIVGCTIARELSRFDCSVAVLVCAEDVCGETSKTNSAIIRAEFDAPAGSLKAQLDGRGNAMVDQLAAKSNIPFRRSGSLVLCFERESLPQIHALYERGLTNGVPSLHLLSGDEVRALEPAVSAEAVAALYAPMGGIACPFFMTYALFENAKDSGVRFFFGSPAAAVSPAASGYTAATSSGSVYHAVLLINAAGVYGNILHNRICKEKVRIVPRHGEYCLFGRRDGGLVSRAIFQLPGALGKGAHTVSAANAALWNE